MTNKPQTHFIQLVSTKQIVHPLEVFQHHHRYKKLRIRVLLDFTTRKSGMNVTTTVPPTCNQNKSKPRVKWSEMRRKKTGTKASENECGRRTTQSTRRSEKTTDPSK